MFSNNELVKELPNLKKFAYKLTRNEADAEDLLHNTCLRAIEKKHLFKKGSNIFKWASRIMYNLFVSVYRRKTKFETQYDPEPYIATQSTDATQDLKIEFKHMTQAMKRLSHEHQEVLILVSVQGMRYAEVADALNIPVGTVRSRLSRAREQLSYLMDTKTSFNYRCSNDDTHNDLKQIAA